MTQVLDPRSISSVLLTVTFVLMFGANAWAETFSIAGRSLSINVPRSYCALDRDDPVENQMFRTMERIQDGLNRVLIVFYDCAELRSMRSGEDRNFDRYGQILTPVREQAYPGVSREMFFAELRKVFDRAFSIGVERGRSNVERVIPNMQTGEARSLGILGNDPRALYAGMLEKVAFDGNATTVAAVVSMTLVRDVPISVNLYRPYENETSFDRLLEEQRAYMDQLIRSNEQLEGHAVPGPNPSGPGG